MESDDEIWQTSVVKEDYEICANFPHQIRKKANGRILKESFSRGYHLVTLNRKLQRKHRIIALQFIPNPDNLPQVDHINRIRNDNRIENLRWVSCSENSQNKSSNKGCYYEYFDVLPAPCRPFIFYNGHDLEGYMVDENHNIYFHNGLMYRKLIVVLIGGKYEYYYLRDIEAKVVAVSLNRIDDFL
jgi:hypothetical protein